MYSVSRSAAINAGEGEYVMEYQVESERGFQLLGSDYFSATMRLYGDPARFTSPEGQPLGQRLLDYEVPDVSWVWAWSRWYVDMSADVDDQGWCYSWRFGSRRWSGKHRFMRSFTRQRLWKRPRVKRVVLERTLDLNGPPDRDNELKIEGKPSLVTDEEEECYNKLSNVLKKLAKLRNDRERMDWIYEAVTTDKANAEMLTAARAQVMATLRFPVSRKTLITRLSQSSSAEGELFAMVPSSNWRDGVLLHGEPQKDVASDTDDA